MTPLSVPSENGSRDALRVIEAATDLSGAADKASLWFENENLAAFAFKTAEQLVREGRADDLLAYLHALKAGAAG